MFFAASITEIVLIKSFQASDSLARKNYIDYIVDKYKLPKKSKDLLEMLIDSVYNSPLKNEYELIAHLPPSFRDQVINSIREV